MSKKTFNQYRDDFDKARTTVEKLTALNGMTETASIRKQWVHIGDVAWDHPKIQVKALNKAADLTKTVLGMIEICKIPDKHTQIRRDLENRLVELAEKANSKKGWENVFDYSECGSKLEDLARRKKNGQ